MSGNEEALGGPRRRFLEALAGTGAALALRPRAVHAGALEYKYRTIAIEHLQDVKDWLARLDREGQLSSNPIFRSILEKWFLYAPKTLKNARSLILAAVPGKLASVTFHLDGRAFDVPIPSGYAKTFDISSAALARLLATEVLCDPEARLEPTAALPVKTLAVHSGLAEYGKNNITYVEDLGSYYNPELFFCDRELPDQWGPLKTMRLCKGCSICVDACPTKAISNERFVIDPGRCLTLYNERIEPMPDWIDRRHHHALVGCLRCQNECPANALGRQRIEKLADVSEKETKLLLECGDDRSLLLSLGKKLTRYPGAWNLTRLCRNFRLACANIAKN